MNRIASKLGSILGTASRWLAPASIPVSAVILSRMATVTPQQSLYDVAQLLVAGDSVPVPVVEHGKTLGIVTRDRLAGSLTTSGPNTPVGLCTLSEVVECSPGDSLDDVLEQLRRSPGAVALVIDQGAPVGMVTEAQLDAYLAAQG